jgi:Flp pilus assembly protein TadG
MSIVARQSVASVPAEGDRTVPVLRRLRGKAGELGQSVVEMALVLPVFLLLFTGVVEVGDALNSYLTVVDVSRDGARLASKGMATDADIRNMAEVEMARLRDGFDPATDMTITHDVVPGDSSIRVEVCSDHSLLLPVLSTFVGDPLRMCAQTTMRTISFED